MDETKKKWLQHCTVTTTELLDLLVKANKISSEIVVTKTSNFYLISIYAFWDEDNNVYDKSTYISVEGHSIWDPEAPGDYDFYTMSTVLDDRVQKEEEKKIKRQKREELLSRLTDEEKELLGL